MALTVTSKQRAYLRSLAMTTEPIAQIGKAGLTPEVTSSVEQAIAARELVKISVLKSCDEDIHELAETLAGRTRSLLVQIVGHKITLYRPAKEPVIVLPKKNPGA
jgi:RNA-binding protein